MESIIKNTLNDFTLNIGFGFSLDKHDEEIKDIEHNNDEQQLQENKEKNKHVYYPFKLPIYYLQNEDICDLNTCVIEDLEMDKSPETPMYDLLFQPKHEFSKNLIQEWKHKISTNTQYLKETQDILKEMNEINNHSTPIKDVVDTEYLMNIWKDIKEDERFLEKYSYIEFDFLKNFNHSEAVLQLISITNLVSPLVSLIIPIIVLLVPFLVLQIRGTNITFSLYIQVLKDLTKNHFIGTAIQSFQSFDWNKLIYFFISAGMYFLQIYNNITTCMHFYRNCKKINEQLIFLRSFVTHSCERMELFIQLHQSKTTYVDFCKDMEANLKVLQNLKDELTPITPFIQNISITETLSKISQLGYLLKCYYQLYSNNQYTDALCYSFGFEGFMDALSGICSNLKTENIHMCEFVNKNTSKKDIVIKNQYYPPHGKKNSVKNNFILSNKENGITITGPNSSGKTTFLKTTAINVIFTQQFGVGFYDKCKLYKPYTYIHSYLNIPDTSGRDSLFQAESKRCKEIIDSIHLNEKTKKHFCIFDELYSGTNPVEATKASYLFLKYLSKYDNVHFILTTHYTSVCNKIKKTIPSITNYKMNVEFEKTTNVNTDNSDKNPGNKDENNSDNNQGGDSNDNKMIYTYELKRGISNIEGAYAILKSLKYPKEILNGWCKHIKP